MPDGPTGIEREGAFRIRFPAAGSLDQDREWFEFDHEGRTGRLRIHDYAQIYRIPGLYEALVYGALQCDSPRRVSELLAAVLADWPESLDKMRVLDLGAGNGIVAEELRNLGAGHVVGLDLLPEAAEAARRDRPGVYDDYIVADLSAMDAEERRRLRDARANCLITVAALGFGDIPPEAFAVALNAVSSPGWLAMTIKEDFLDASSDDSGFARLVRTLIEMGIIEIQAHHRFCHRLSIDGEQLFYMAVIARKLADVPREAIDAADQSETRVPADAARKDKPTDGSAKSAPEDTDPTSLLIGGAS